MSPPETEEVIRHFPDLKVDIIAKFHDDPTFREICRDYQQCSIALRYWKTSAAPEADERVREYEHFLNGLNNELAELLLLDIDTGEES